MKRITTLFLALLLVLTLTSCKSSDKPKETPNNETDVVEKEDNKTTKKEKPKEKKPERALPENLPVYPGSYITGDFEEDQNAWTWAFYAPASAKEIIEFFNDELSYLGLQLHASKTTMGPLVDVATIDYGFILGFIEESDRTVDEDTPEREYAIAVSFDEWDESLTRDKENDPRPKINLETVDSSKFGDYEPERDVPKILPVYPSSILTADTAATMTGTKWQWAFHVNASEDEIVEFFEKELSNLGIEFGVHKEAGVFIINTRDSIIEVMGISAEEEDDNGPGYNYSIVVDLVALSDF